MSENVTVHEQRGKQPEARNVLLNLEQVILVDTILPHLLLPLMYIATHQTPHYVLSLSHHQNYYSMVNPLAGNGIWTTYTGNIAG